MSATSRVIRILFRRIWVTGHSHPHPPHGVLPSLIDYAGAPFVSSSFMSFRSWAQCTVGVVILMPSDNGVLSLDSVSLTVCLCIDTECT